MKRILLLSLLLLPIVALAQYPTFSNKQKLGVQTTGDGLIFRGNLEVPNYQPSNVNNAYFYLDTVRNTLKFYKDGWIQIYPSPQFDTTTLNVYLKISDTTAMLLPYFRDSDTTSLNLINRFALKLNISDTATMLTPYMKKTDTISLSNRINLKLNISDTTILSNRITTNANNIITINNKLATKLDTIYVKFKNVVTMIENKDTINIGSSLTDGYAINIIGDSVNVDTTLLDIRYPDRDSTNELQDITFATTAGIVTISGSKVINLDTLYNSVIDSVNLLIRDSIAAFTPLTEGYGINIIGDSINVDTSIIFTQSDTITLSNRINLKLNTSDTITLSNRINTKLNSSDTVSLSNRIDLKLNKSDTASLSNRINLKLNISDTANMLAPYLKEADTINLSNRINTKIDTIYVNYQTNVDVITNKDTINITPLTEGFGINIIADSINIDSAVILATQQKQIAYVKNSSGVTIYKGQAVYSSGSSGNNKLVTLASSATEQTSSKTFGVVETDSIPNGSHGYIITFGLLSGINTNALTEGYSVYLSNTPGQLTTIKPIAPLHLVTIGVCIRQQQNNGSIFVKIQNGFEFDELHDVRLTDLVNKASIYYNLSEKLWRDTTAALLVSDTASMLNPYLRKLDTISLSNRINLKFNTTDTSILGYVTTYSNQLNINGNKTFNNTVSVDSLNSTKQAKIQSLTVGRGGIAIIGGTPGGISSTAFGFEALKNNTSGDWNTAIGYQTLLNNTTAWNNVAIGNNSLNLNTVGEYNTAIGVESLFSNKVGNNNVAIGYYAGTNNKGNNNIYIGNQTYHTDSVNNVLMIGGINTPLLSGITTGNKKLGINKDPISLTYTFEVYSPISDAVKINSNTNSTNLELANNSGNSVFIKSTNRNMVLQTDTTALMYLNGETNRVGILTMTPEQALEVNGTIRIDSLDNTLNPTKLVGSNASNDLTDVKLGTGLSISNDTLKIADNIINSGDTATLLRQDFLGINTNVLTWQQGSKKLLPYFTQVYRNGQLLKSESQYTITNDSIVTLAVGSFKLDDNITIIAIDNIIALAGGGGIITLQGDVTGSGTNTITTTIGANKVTNTMLVGSISDSKLSTITTAGKVSNTATTATNLNTNNAIVLRDASGNFSAGTITASLNGNANTSTTLATGRTIAITGDLTYTSPSFNGSTNVTAVGTLANSGVTANTYTAATITVDAKGRITSASANTIPTVNNGNLIMNVSGNGLTGSRRFTANQSTDSTFTVTSNATNANTPSTIVYRDSSGNFSAGNITANTFIGNATTSTTSTSTVNVLNYLNSNELFKFRSTNATNVTGQILITTPGTDFSLARNDAAQTFTGTQTFSSTIIGSISGNAATATNVAYSGLTGTVPTWNQNTTGNAATVTTNANLTGDVTSTGNTTSIATGVIVNADINASAAIAVSKLAASTISGVTLGNNLNTLTISSPLTGTSYNGSSAVSIGLQAATTSVAGSMSAADKTKLDGIAAGATANTGTVTSVAALTLTTTGTDITSSVATGTTTPVITLNIPNANTTNRGVLTSTDWTTFNNKQAALSGLGFIKASGTTITYDNSTYLTTSSASTTYLAKTDTAAMLLPYFRDADTTTLNLTSRFASKLNISDTAAMLSNYNTRINSKLNISDTLLMLTPYFRDADTTSLNLTSRFATKLNISDTAAMLANYNTRINLKLNTSDTAAMLIPYLRKLDTVSLSNRINLKVNISDTLNMLVPYLRKADTTLMLSKYLRRADTSLLNLTSRFATKLNYTDTSFLFTQSDTSQLNLTSRFNTKQNTLVSGTNIKTVNSNSLLGSGNISVGTVTSVGGTGTVSGLTLTGSITGSGNLTLGGGLILTIEDVVTALGYIPYNSTNPNGYIRRTDLSFVAGSGAYDNTTGVITIPTNNNQITNGAGYATLASPTFTGTVGGITKTMVGLGNVDNTNDLNKPISTLTQTALNGKLNLSGGTLTGELTGTSINLSSTINSTGDIFLGSNSSHSGLKTRYFKTTDISPYRDLFIGSVGTLGTWAGRMHFQTSYNNEVPTTAMSINEFGNINMNGTLDVTGVFRGTTAAFTNGISIDDITQVNGSNTLFGSRYLYLGSSSINGGGVVFQYNASNGIDLWSYDTSLPVANWRRKFTFTKEGNFGINNTSPNSKLDVNGTLNVTEATTLSSTLKIGTTNTVAPTSILGKDNTGVVGGIIVGNGLILSNSTLSLASGGGFITTNSDYTVTITDTWIVFNNNFNNITVTLPNASTSTGRTLYFRNVAAGSIVSAGTANIIDNTITTGTPNNNILGAGNTNVKWCTLVSNGQYWIKMQAGSL